MKIISQADVVLALGSRLGPFGSLPQYGFDYWPKTAKIIQVRNKRKVELEKFFVEIHLSVVLVIIYPSNLL